MIGVAFAGRIRDDGLDLDRIVFQVVKKFFRPAVVKFPGGRAVKFLAAPFDVQRIARATVGGEKLFGRFSRDVKLAEF